jgi:hypothetical protein
MENQKPLNVDTMSLEAKQLHTSHTDRLSDTAEVVREVSKKIGKYLSLIYINIKY